LATLNQSRFRSIQCYKNNVIIQEIPSNKDGWFHYVIFSVSLTKAMYKKT